MSAVTVLAEEMAKGSSVLGAVVSKTDDLLMNFSSNDGLSILIFGLTFLLFAYGSVFGYYANGLKKLNDGQANLMQLIGVAFIIQLASLLFVTIVIIFGLDLLSKHDTSAGLTVGTATILFFKVNWLEVDLLKAIQVISESGKSSEILTSIIIIQGLWITLTVVFFIFPLIALLMLVAYISKKHNEKKLGDSSQYGLITDIFNILIVSFFIFGIHLIFPSVFLKGIEKNNATQVEKYTKDLIVIDDYDYQGRAKPFVEKSLDMLNERKDKK